MGIYGVISNKAGGHVVTTILIAMVAMLFTAISYGKMARAYPSAGLGVYVRREGDSSRARLSDRLGDGDGLHPESADLHGDLQQAHAEHSAGDSLLRVGSGLRRVLHGDEPARVSRRRRGSTM